LIAAEQAGLEHVLEGLFSSIIYPPAVWHEALAPDRTAAGLSTRPWLKQLQARDQVFIAELIGRERLSRADAEVIALAKQEKLLAVVDDRRARGAATEQGVRVIGLAGLLLIAKDAGIVAEVRPVLDALARTGFRLSEAIRREILRRAGE